MLRISGVRLGLAVIAAAASSGAVVNLLPRSASADTTGVSTSDLHCSASATEFTASYTVANHTGNMITLQPFFAVDGALVGGGFETISVPPYTQRVESAVAAAGHLDYNAPADQCEVYLSQQ